MNKWEDTFTEQINYFDFERRKCFAIAFVCLILTILTAFIKTENSNAVQDINTLFCLSCIIFSTIGGIMGKQSYYATVNRRQVSTLMDRIDTLEKQLGIKETSDTDDNIETTKEKDTEKGEN
jgi:hypothetical protein